MSSVAALRTRTLKAARGFSDYNFRSYFVQHTKDRFSSFKASNATAAELEIFKKESEERLAQMKRMALLNTMYADQKVILDSRVATQQQAENNATVPPSAAAP